MPRTTLAVVVGLLPNKCLIRRSLKLVVVYHEETLTKTIISTGCIILSLVCLINTVTSLPRLRLNASQLVTPNAICWSLVNYTGKMFAGMLFEAFNNNYALLYYPVHTIMWL